MKRAIYIALVCAAVTASGASRVIRQNVETKTARVEPSAIGLYRGESITYIVVPTYTGAVITATTNATARWTVTARTNTAVYVIDVTGTVATNSTATCTATTNQTRMAAGTYDSYLAIIDGAALICAARSTLTVYDSAFADTAVVAGTEVYYRASNPSNYVTGAALAATSAADRAYADSLMGSYASTGYVTAAISGKVDTASIGQIRTIVWDTNVIVVTANVTYPPNPEVLGIYTSGVRRADGFIWPGVDGYDTISITYPGDPPGLTESAYAWFAPGPGEPNKPYIPSTWAYELGSSFSGHIDVAFACTTNTAGTAADETTLLLPEITPDYVRGHLIPYLDEEYDLGSASRKWRTLYLKGSTIFLGDTEISAATITSKLATNGSANGLSGCPGGAATTGSVAVASNLAAAAATPADVTNSLNLAISPSLTDTVTKAASALQVESQTLASLGGITNTAAGIAGAGGVTNGGATVNGVVISNGAAILTYSVAPTVLTATYPTQWISVAHGGWQYLAPTGATTLAFSNDWPTPNSSLINLALFSAAAVAVDSATVSTSMWALCTLSTTATNELTFKRGFGWPRWVPVASSNWLNP